MKLIFPVLLFGTIFSTQLLVAKAQLTTRCKKGCMENNVECVTSTTYIVCLNGEKYGDTQTCPVATYCSDGHSVCMPPNNTTVDFVCGSVNSGSGDCGECKSGDVFTCVDRTHFSMCDNPTAYISCKAGEICIKRLLEISDLICITPKVATQVGLSPSCDAATTTTTTTLGPPVTPQMNEALIACITASTGMQIFSIPNALDPTCRTYIHCESNVGGMQALSMRCGADKFYDNAKQGCTSTFVNSCDSSKSETTTSI